MPSRAEVVAQARGWIGVNWQHQGRTRRGVDCAGLVIMVAHELGISDYDTHDYQRRTHGHAFLHHFKDHMEQVPVPDVRPGDILLFRDGSYPCHSSIVAESHGELTIIHAHAPRRMVVEEPLSQADWLQKRVAAFCYPGVEG